MMLVAQDRDIDGLRVDVQTDACGYREALPLEPEAGDHPHRAF